jgi:uncharacterized LabA/DUF88 family protein
MKIINIALFIDVENYKEPQHLFSQFSNGLATLGKVTHKVAIGGWGHNKYLENWKPVCKEMNIKMRGYNEFNGKNAADRAIVSEAAKLIKSQAVNAIAIYSRDTGFAIGIAALKVLGATLIVPRMGNEYIPDADHYIKIDRDKLLVTDAKTELGIKLLKVMPKLFI